MAGTDVAQLLQVQRTAANPYPDNQPIGGKPRGGRYGEQTVLSYVPTKHLLADEGSYFVATSPTPGTAVTYALQQTFSDTAAGMFLITNTDSNNGTGRRIYLDYIRLLVVTAGASATSVQYAIKTDNVPRAPTAGNTQITPVCVNSDLQSAQSPCNFWAFSAAAMTLPAASGSARLVSRGTLRSVISVAGDELVLAFGDNPPGGVIGTTAGRVATHAPPIVIGPGQSMAFYLWEPAVASTAPTFEYEVGFWAR